MYKPIPIDTSDIILPALSASDEVELLKCP